VPSTSFRNVHTPSKGGWVQAGCAWTPTRHECCDSVPDRTYYIGRLTVRKYWRQLSVARDLSVVIDNGWPCCVALSFRESRTYDTLNVLLRSLSADAAKLLVQCSSLVAWTTATMYCTASLTTCINNCNEYCYRYRGRQESIPPVHWLPVLIPSGIQTRHRGSCSRHCPVWHRRVYQMNVTPVAGYRHLRVLCRRPILICVTGRSLLLVLGRGTMDSYILALLSRTPWWNLLSASLRLMDNYTRFRRLLKAH